MIVVLIPLLLAMLQGCQATPDPCNHHAALNDTWRGTSNVLTAGREGVCENQLASGWYRFVGPAGTQLATYCVQGNRCGTLTPLWMSGAHPAVADGIVKRDVCANFGHGADRTGCCAHTIQIGVKNCGAFYVYFLHAVPTCPWSYCVDDGGEHHIG